LDPVCVDHLCRFLELPRGIQTGSKENLNWRRYEPE